MNGSTGECFRTTEVGKDVLFHPPSSSFSSKGFSDALEENDVNVNIGGRIISNMPLRMILTLLLRKTGTKTPFDLHKV